MSGEDYDDAEEIMYFIKGLMDNNADKVKSFAIFFGY